MKLIILFVCGMHLRVLFLRFSKACTCFASDDLLSVCAWWFSCASIMDLTVVLKFVKTEWLMVIVLENKFVVERIGVFFWPSNWIMTPVPVTNVPRCFNASLNVKLYQVCLSYDHFLLSYLQKYTRQVCMTYNIVISVMWKNTKRSEVRDTDDKAVFSSWDWLSKRVNSTSLVALG